MQKSKHFMTTGLICAMLSAPNAYGMNFEGLAYELISDVALAFQNENEQSGGYHVDTISIGTDMSALEGRSDVLNYGGDAQYIKMTGVTIPGDFITKPLPQFNDKYEFDFLSAFDGKTIPEALAMVQDIFGESEQSAAIDHLIDLLNAGKITDGYLTTDGTMVVDGQYGKMFQKLVTDNQEAKEALVTAIANMMGQPGLADAGNMGIDMIVTAVAELGTGNNDAINEMVKTAQNAGVELEYTGKNTPLTLTAKQINMAGGNLVVKNGVTMHAGAVEIAGGNINVAQGTNDFVNTIDAGIFNMTGGKLTVAENANLAMAGDMLNIASGATLKNDGNIQIKSTTATISGDISGNGTMHIANGAKLNIGDATIVQDKITLDGEMIANLKTDQTKFTANTFDGDGKLQLILRGAGEYTIFGNAAFANDQTTIDADSALYNLAWSDDKKSISATLKTIAEIAADNNLSHIATTTVSTIANSASDTLQDLAVRVQEHLITGDVESVEHASRAINPEIDSVHQAVATGITGTISNLASARMALPAFVGRNGGDITSLAGGVWAQGLYNKSKLNDSFNGYTRGVAAGMDGTINRAITIGAGYAFNHSDIALNFRDLEIDSHTVFAYGQYKPSAWYVNTILNYTMSDYTENADALGVALNADYELDMFGAAVMTGYDTSFGLTPEMGVRYMHIDGDTYTNNLGIRAKINDADYLTGVLGAKYVTQIDVRNGIVLHPELRAALLYDFVTDKIDSAVSMPGVASYGVRADRLDRVGGQFGIGMTMTYAGANLSLNYIIETRNDYTSQTGMIRARYNF